MVTLEEYTSVAKEGSPSFENVVLNCMFSQRGHDSTGNPGKHCWLEVYALES